MDRCFNPRGWLSLVIPSVHAAEFISCYFNERTEHTGPPSPGR